MTVLYFVVDSKAFLATIMRGYPSMILQDKEASHDPV